jgi:hypothetical protein
VGCPSAALAAPETSSDSATSGIRRSIQELRFVRTLPRLCGR